MQIIHKYICTGSVRGQGSLRGAVRGRHKLFQICPSNKISKHIFPKYQRQCQILHIYHFFYTIRFSAKCASIPKVSTYQRKLYTRPIYLSKILKQIVCLDPELSPTIKHLIITMSDLRTLCSILRKFEFRQLKRDVLYCSIFPFLSQLGGSSKRIHIKYGY